jgi:hypothetical protein
VDKPRWITLAGSARNIRQHRLLGGFAPCRLDRFAIPNQPGIPHYGARFARNFCATRMGRRKSGLAKKTVRRSAKLVEFEGSFRIPPKNRRRGARRGDQQRSESLFVVKSNLGRWGFLGGRMFDSSAAELWAGRMPTMFSRSSVILGGWKGC